MTPIRLFISSVQKEFAAERAALRDYLRGDALMRRFFEAFLFEDVPAANRARVRTGSCARPAERDSRRRPGPLWQSLVKLPWKYRGSCRGSHRGSHAMRPASGSWVE